jgi:hypothetical protein
LSVVTSTGVTLGRADGLLEEPTGGLGVPPRGDEHVDDLPELVDRAVGEAPRSRHLHIGLVYLPAVTDSMSAGLGGLGQQGREAQHPAVDRHMVYLDTPAQ